MLTVLKPLIWRVGHTGWCTQGGDVFCLITLPELVVYKLLFLHSAHFMPETMVTKQKFFWWREVLTGVAFCDSCLFLQDWHPDEVGCYGWYYSLLVVMVMGRNSEIKEATRNVCSVPFQIYTVVFLVWELWVFLWEIVGNKKVSTCPVWHWNK